MSDRIDTGKVRAISDADRRDATQPPWRKPHAEAVLALCDEVEALRSREARLTEEAVGVVEVVKFRHAEYGASPDFVQTAVLLAIIDRLVPVEEP